AEILCPISSEHLQSDKVHRSLHFKHRLINKHRSIKSQKNLPLTYDREPAACVSRVLLPLLLRRPWLVSVLMSAAKTPSRSKRFINRNPRTIHCMHEPHKASFRSITDQRPAPLP